jgi:hypothetical protein
MVETGRAGPSHNHYDYNQRLTSAAEARPLTSPLPYRFSVDLGHHIRSTGACAVPCHQEAALGSRRPRTWGRSVVQLGPYDNFAATRVTRQFKLKPLRERFSGWRIVWMCRSCRSAQSPTLTASALPRAGAVLRRRIWAAEFYFGCWACLFLSSSCCGCSSAANPANLELGPRAGAVTWLLKATDLQRFIASATAPRPDAPTDKA